MIYIQYEKTDGTNTFHDVLVLQEDHTLTEQDIENLKQTRFQNWLTVISTPTITLEESV